MDGSASSSECVAPEVAVSISPRGEVRISGAASTRPAALGRAPTRGLGATLLQLAGPMLHASLGAELRWLRSIGREYLAAECRGRGFDPAVPPGLSPSLETRLLAAIPQPSIEQTGAAGSARSSTEVDGVGIESSGAASANVP